MLNKTARTVVLQHVPGQPEKQDEPHRPGTEGRPPTADRTHGGDGKASGQVESEDGHGVERDVGHVRAGDGSHRPAHPAEALQELHDEIGTQQRLDDELQRVQDDLARMRSSLA